MSDKLPPCDHDDCSPTHCKQQPSPSSLEKAIEEYEKWYGHYTSHPHHKAIMEVLTSAKQLSTVQKERDEYKERLLKFSDSPAGELFVERQKLQGCERQLKEAEQQLQSTQLALKEAGEALNDLMTQPSIADKRLDGTVFQYSFQTNSIMHFQINKALQNPLTIAAMKEK